MLIWGWFRESGVWLFTTDQYHVKENYEANAPQGWLARDHDDWIHSNQWIKSLAKRTHAKVVIGHDKEVSFSKKLRKIFLPWASADNDSVVVEI